MTTIQVKIDGIDATLAALSSGAKQISFAAARALTVTAHSVHSEIKKELGAGIQEGPPLHSARIQGTCGHRCHAHGQRRAAHRRPARRNPYEQAIAHLFHGGVRRFKRLEGLLRDRGLIPAGLQIAPGKSSRSTAEETQSSPNSRRWSESSAPESGISRPTGAQENRKKPKPLGFVVMPNATASRWLHPGIWRRIRSGNGSVIEPWFMYVSPPPYQQQFDLDKTAQTVVGKVWGKNPDRISRPGNGHR